MKQSRNLLRILISAAVISIILMRVDRAALWSHIRSVTPFDLLGLMLLVLATTGVTTLRFQTILGARSRRIRFSEQFYLWLIGGFFSAFLPSGVAGDVVRIAKLSSRIGSVTETAAWVLLDRGIALILVLMTFSVSAALLPESFLATLGISRATGYTVAAVGVLLSISLFWSPFRSRIQRHLFSSRRLTPVFEVLQSMTTGRLTLALCVGTGVILINWVIHRWVCAILKVDVPPAILVMMITSGFLAIVVPMSVGGLGIREGFYYLFFRALALPPDAGVALGFIVYGVNLLVSLLAGLLFLFDERCFQRAPAASAGSDG